ncbi:hypothetical protein I4F81_008077 [Pyropia yezoensis]|uniref:Uncharacterized protein n=1 Tax=Pyropia yezoensis TaxID=2788 RepID=A0ACC3C5X0_PYRYE|nr:hypothetical protein I4F81_008077 [Neopyropia yezoensis]
MPDAVEASDWGPSSRRPAWPSTLQLAARVQAAVAARPAERRFLSLDERPEGALQSHGRLLDSSRWALAGCGPSCPASASTPSTECGGGTAGGTAVARWRRWSTVFLGGGTFARGALHGHHDNGQTPSPPPPPSCPRPASSFPHPPRSPFPPSSP